MSAENIITVLSDLMASAGGEAAGRAQINVGRVAGARADMVVNGLSGGALKEIAAAIAGHASVRDAAVRSSRIEVLLHDEVIDRLAGDLAGEGASLRPAQSLSGQRWIINLFDPNATKAMHIGHLRNLSHGMALGQLCASHGASVGYQSVVNDMGRSVAEAIAGYLASDCKSPGEGGMKPDHFVGRCYASYVAKMPNQQLELSAADEPIRRELLQFRDAADAVLEKWFAGDEAVRAAWKALMQWTLDGHRATIESCGLPVPVSLMQTDHFPAAARLLSDGLESGLLRRGDGGTIYFPTDRAEYQQFPLARPDGMSTEHLRTVAVWRAILSRDEPTRFLHVLGDEWRISTECRLQLFEQLGHGAGASRYQGVYHGMVVGRSGKLASSAGTAPLLDEELARVARAPVIASLAARTGQPAPALARVAIGALMLSRRPAKPIPYSPEDVLDPRNPGIAILEALDLALANSAGAIQHRHDAPEVRLQVLRAQLLARMISLSWERHDPEPVLRHLLHLAESYREAGPCALVARIISNTLTSGMRAIALWPDRGEMNS
jgi:arginyl-tRNA synthetase